MSNQFTLKSATADARASSVAPMDDAGIEERTQPADAVLRRQIAAKLAQRGISISDRLTVEIHNGVVRVAGRVPTNYQRQLIVHAIRQIPTVVEIVDIVEVLLSQDAEKQLALTTETAGENIVPTFALHD